ncbi:MAG TPA: DUF4147 domain-containing protein [Candidatus Nitrosocosmicus sp.]|nr:DUF4147 domain-containing protein [Candidatus Nitrosocosmicus sp.]
MSLIKNRASILRYHKFQSVEDSLNALEFAFRSCCPEKLVDSSISMDSKLEITDIKGKFSEYPLPRSKSILVISVGKASEKMLSGFAIKMGDKIARSVLIIPKGYKIKNKQQFYVANVSIISSSHPIPNRNSLLASRTIIKELQHLNNIELVIFLISGGSSSLVVSPIQGLRLSDKREINRLLISCGADINEINIVRKHLSQIKGGKILRLLKPRRKVISLILSDVVGDNFSTIGSGLTYYDDSSYADAIGILQKYSILEYRSDSITNVSAALKRGIGTDIFETVKAREFNSLRTDNYIIGNNSIFCQKIKYHLESLGYHVDYKGSEFNLNMNEFSKFTEEIFEQLQKGNTAILIGGELTNVIDKVKTGTGGRNQEAVCRMMDLMDPLKNSDCTVICMGTDGIDGNSKSAGGILSPSTLQYLKLKRLNISEFLESHNSNILLKSIHSTINTGYTGTNFNDVYLFVRKT